jgi:hypothetical protein
MAKDSSSQFGSRNRVLARNDAVDRTAVVPFGRYGAGLLTGHPVGLVVAAGVVLITLVAIPPARWFFAGSLALGAVIGFFLWLHNRTKSFD